MVVLFPIGMIGGVVGLFVKSFALTLLIMALVSLSISFTMTPILCSLTLKPEKDGSLSLLGGMEKVKNVTFGWLLKQCQTLLYGNSPFNALQP